jgi:hypothetical protein
MLGSADEKCESVKAKGWRGWPKNTKEPKNTKKRKDPPNKIGRLAGF